MNNQEVLEIVRRPKIVTAFVLLSVLLAYVPAIRGDFFSDDFPYVIGNQHLQSIPLLQSWRLFIERSNPYEFLPIRDLSYRLDMALFGLRPFGYHVHNLILYLLCCCAVWFCCSSLLRLFGAYKSHHSWICATVTILFAVHPAHVESVAWISGRKDLLSGLFALLSLQQFARALQPDNPNWRRLLLAYGLLSLALMSKLTSLPTAGVAILLAAARTRIRMGNPVLTKKILLAVLPMAILAFCWTWLAITVGSTTGIKADPFATEVMRRIGFPLTQIKILGYLTRIAFAPVHLRLIYDVAQPGLPSILSQILGAITLAGGILGGVLAWRRGSLFGYACAIVLLFCLPFLQLVPFFTWSAVSERFLFLPVFGVALGLALLLVENMSPIRRNGLALAVVIVAIVLTFQQTSKWAVPPSLTEDTARLSPGSYAAQSVFIHQVLLPARRYEEAKEAATKIVSELDRRMMLGFVDTLQAMDRGDWTLAASQASGLTYITDRHSLPSIHRLLAVIAEKQGDYFQAARHYYYAEKSSSTHGDLKHARDSLARIRVLYADRISRLRHAVQARPDDVAAYGDLANLEMELYLLDEAAAKYYEILRRNPGHPAVLYNLGLVHYRQGKYRESIAELEQATDQGINNASAWNNLAIAYKSAGEIESAERAFRRALEVDPQDCYSLINLGRLHLALNSIQEARKNFETSRMACSSELEELIDLYLKQAQ